MGIKNLNKYLYENCSKTTISKIHLRKLSGKTVVIDTSIYLYHFLAEKCVNGKYVSVYINLKII